MKPILISWMQANTTAISSSQTTLVQGGLDLDGPLASQVILSEFWTNLPAAYAQLQNPVTAIDLRPLKQSRTVSLASDTDNTTVTFTISGVYFGKIVEETISGPNAVETVETTQYFDIIFSISADLAFTNVSAGVGTKGKTNWIYLNYNSIGVSNFTIGLTGLETQSGDANATFSFWVWNGPLQEFNTLGHLVNGSINPGFQFIQPTWQPSRSIGTGSVNENYDYANGKAINTSAVGFAVGALFFGAWETATDFDDGEINPVTCTFMQQAII